VKLSLCAMPGSLPEEIIAKVRKDKEKAAAKK
jgi:hypothetical protein